MALRRKHIVATYGCVVIVLFASLCMFAIRVTLAPEIQTSYNKMISRKQATLHADWLRSHLSDLAKYRKEYEDCESVARQRAFNDDQHPVLPCQMYNGPTYIPSNDPSPPVYYAMQHPLRAFLALLLILIAAGVISVVPTLLAIGAFLVFRKFALAFRALP